MTRPRLSDAPAFWHQLQGEFSHALGSPLRIGKGGFASSVDGARALRMQLAGPTDGLGLYHQQRWTRLFETLQKTYPRLARGVGYFQFNLLAHDYLLARPPRHPDLARIADDFAAFARSALRSPSRPNPDALTECLELDEAERRAFVAAVEPLWQPTAAELAELPIRRLRFNPALTVLRQNYAVRTARGSDETAIFVRLRASKYVTTCREGSSVVTRTVVADFARFLEAACELPFAAVLERLVAETPASERDGLSTKVQTWLTVAVKRGYFTGLV
jgi:hypothetical protein